MTIDELIKDSKATILICERYRKRCEITNRCKSFDRKSCNEECLMGIERAKAIIGYLEELKVRRENDDRPEEPDCQWK